MFNFVNNSALHENKQPVKMELAKITAYLTGFINVFLYISAWFANLDNTKSSILFIVALIMSGYRFYRWGITSIQNKKLKDIQIERERLQIRREELDVLERENRLIRTKF